MAARKASVKKKPTRRKLPTTWERIKRMRMGYSTGKKKGKKVTSLLGARLAAEPGGVEKNKEHIKNIVADFALDAANIHGERRSQIQKLLVDIPDLNRSDIFEKRISDIHKNALVKELGTARAAFLVHSFKRNLRIIEQLIIEAEKRAEKKDFQAFMGPDPGPELSEEKIEGFITDLKKRLAKKNSERK